MVIGIRGEIIKKDLSFCDCLTASGLIYRVFVSLNCYSQITTNKANFLTTQIIKEDGHYLYGFLDENEQKMFEMLLKVSGIGAKSAMAICSTFSPSDFAKILGAKDLTSLTKVPGIGKKTASLILVELAEMDFTQTSVSPNVSQATSALLSLGFKKEAIAKTLNSCTATNLEDLVKEALQKLTKVKK